MRSLVSLVVLFLVALGHAVSSTGSRLLAIMDDVVAEKVTYSKFLADLEGRGYDISYETPKSEKINLFHLGERAYDHVLLFPSKSKGLGPNLTAKLLLDFLNAEGNILLTLSGAHSVPSSVVSLLLELDIQLPSDRHGLVVDHFNYEGISAHESHDVLALLLPERPNSSVRDPWQYLSGRGSGSEPAASAAAASDSTSKNAASSSSGGASGSPGSGASEKSGGQGASTSGLLVFPRGTGQTLGDSPLLSPILRAPPTSYSYNPKEEADVIDDLFASGAQLSLVSALQARNSARFVVVGSAEMLSDQWFDTKVKKGTEKNAVKTLNREFAKAVSGWTFKETGVLRVNWIEHHLNEVGAGNETNPKIYRIKNDVTYSISLSEYSWDKYIPFTVPEGDELQLEFSMLSPFQRLKLSPKVSSEDSTTYSVSFKLPDQHGIFNFLVNYKRPFATNVFEKNTVSVRHIAHDEWPRSFVISGAWPWIAGIGATITGWLMFCAVWLYSAPPAKQESKKTR